MLLKVYVEAEDLEAVVRLSTPASATEFEVQLELPCEVDDS
jgi:hypothetical protein